MIEPYNGTLFSLRKDYNKLFGDIKESSDDSDKVFKIKYTMNILASMVTNDLVEAFGETEELEIFHTKSLNDLMNF